jgi:maleylpyruvate isomerase
MALDLSALETSATALIRTVDALGAEELAAPSLLPGWSRAHVVAHLALNGEAMAGVLDAVRRGEPVAMYASDEQRDDDIEELSGSEQADLLDRLLAVTTRFHEAVEAVGEEDAWDATFSRTPGAEPTPVSAIPALRRRELEIHHADLGAVYDRTDWPLDFVTDLLESEAAHHEAGPLALRAVDLDRTWQVGPEGGPTVSGTAADLCWWLSGRGDGAGLSSDAGPLPTLGPWQRATATAVPTPET